MIKKLAISMLLVSVGGGAFISNMESEVSEVHDEFYASAEYNDEEKDYIWNEAIKVVEHDLTNMTFGGNSYEK